MLKKVELKGIKILWAIMFVISTMSFCSIIFTHAEILRGFTLFEAVAIGILTGFFLLRSVQGFLNTKEKVKDEAKDKKAESKDQTGNGSSAGATT